MKDTVKILVTTPAIVGFDVLFNLTDNQVKMFGYPENIRTWGWYSAVELKKAANLRFCEYCKKLGIMHRAMDLDITIELGNFTDLNNPRDQFSWFICNGPGHLQLNRPPKACPFEDELLFVPCAWGKKVLDKAADGIFGVVMKFNGNAIDWEATRLTEEGPKTIRSIN